MSCELDLDSRRSGHGSGDRESRSRSFRIIGERSNDSQIQICQGSERGKASKRVKRLSKQQHDCFYQSDEDFSKWYACKRRDFSFQFNESTNTPTLVFEVAAADQPLPTFEFASEDTPNTCRWPRTICQQITRPSRMH